MKPKDIITLVIATVIIGTCGYFGYGMIFPKKQSADTVSQAEETKSEVVVPKSIDENTFNTVSTLSDYGKPDLSGLGKPDLFADF